MPRTTSAAYRKTPHVNQLPLNCAVPPGTWRRASAGKDGKKGRPELSTVQILRALVGTHQHRGRVWKSNDQETYDEVLHRSFRWLELQQRRFLTVPSWITPDVAHPRYWPLLGMLVAAYRSGALGVLISYEEAAAYFGISRRTWARWIERLAEAGLIRIMPTWLESSSKGRGRDRGRSLYQLGPAIEQLAGEGLMEGLGEGSLRSFRNRMARAARKKAKRRRYDRLTGVWEAQRGDGAGQPAAAQEATQAVSEAEASEVARTSAGSIDNSKGSAILAPHSPPGRASLGSDPEGEEVGPAALSTERALRARAVSSVADDKRTQRHDGNSAAANKKNVDRRRPTHAQHEPEPAANETAHTPGRGAPAVPPANAADLPPPIPDAGRPDTSSTPAEQLPLAERGAGATSSFLGRVVREDPRITFWHDLPGDVLESWGVAAKSKRCRRCAGEGTVGSRWCEASKRRRPKKCDRCDGSGDEP